MPERKIRLKRVWLLPVLALFLAACSQSGPPAVSPVVYPTAEPTPTLHIASEFQEGTNLVPPGKYLFVDYFVINDGIAQGGECPNSLQIDYPGYEFSGGILRAVPGSLELGQGTYGFAGYGTSNRGAMGGGTSSRIEPITRVPHALPNEVVIIYSVLEDGEIVADIEGTAYIIAPGESWQKTVEWDPTPECHALVTYRFTNHGLLDASQIDTR